MHKTVIRPCDENTYIDSNAIDFKSEFGHIPLDKILSSFFNTRETEKIEKIDMRYFGIYSVVNDENAPFNIGENSWFIIVNLPSSQGTNYSVQIAISFWDFNQSPYDGIYIKHGRETTWKKIAIGL